MNWLVMKSLRLKINKKITNNTEKVLTRGLFCGIIYSSKINRNYIGGIYARLYYDTTQPNL